MYKSAAINVSMSETLKKYNVTKCIMHTGLVHHGNSLIFDTACRLQNIPRIFVC